MELDEPVRLGVVVTLEVHPPNEPRAKSWATEFTDEPDERVLSRTDEMHSSPKPSAVRSRPPSKSSADSILFAGDLLDWSWKPHGEMISPWSFTIAQPWSTVADEVVSHRLSVCPEGVVKETGWRVQPLVMQGAVATPGPTHS